MEFKGFLDSLHNKAKRNYLKRVNDKKYPKHLAAKIAKKWGYDYWDGDRRINYGGYKYIPGRWTSIARKLIKIYKLKNKSKILDIGCGKGYLLYELKKINPTFEIYGVDISKYAIKHSKKEINNNLKYSSSTKLPFKNKKFDLAYSINTFHNLFNYDLEKSLKEITRVSRKQYICVESYKNEIEKVNLLYWQVTCESFYTPKEWRWFFEKTKYKGDYSFIYFK